MAGVPSVITKLNCALPEGRSVPLGQLPPDAIVPMEPVTDPVTLQSEPLYSKVTNWLTALLSLVEHTWAVWPLPTINLGAVAVEV
ncbi:MAG: hypothetical protein KCHDKBKB_02014 [Elusimicrobia bacterium]|nr:hypothetical protein [Elusimicrobiota bacterium]